MSQQNSDAASQKALQRFSMSWIVLFALIGVSLVVMSLIGGKQISAADVLYDIGKVIVTVSLADLIILRSLK